MAEKIVAEKVTRNTETRPGQYGTETFWIAYPEHVAGYGKQGDRISHAWGSGKLRREAVAEAEASAKVTAAQVAARP